MYQTFVDGDGDGDGNGDGNVAVAVKNLKSTNVESKYIMNIVHSQKTHFNTEDAKKLP